MLKQTKGGVGKKEEVKFDKEKWEKLLYIE